eukprot:snap_masked-scaffold_42-processed-gene-1.12-mRNA-1 protein AED:1.00 eAED:1.00 QI:0/0/0/0/1/1/2/0/85
MKYLTNNATLVLSCYKNERVAKIRKKMVVSEEVIPEVFKSEAYLIEKFLSKNNLILLIKKQDRRIQYFFIADAYVLINRDNDGTY